MLLINFKAASLQELCEALAESPAVDDRFSDAAFAVLQWPVAKQLFFGLKIEDFEIVEFNDCDHCCSQCCDCE